MNLKKIWRQLTAPKIFNRGYLPEAGGHQVYFVEMGNPRGIPVLVFHGGPGGGMNLRYAQPFDRRKYRVILFDQRGCGKSLPLGEMKNNNTGALLEDAARLLRYLGIEDRVIVRGASWGSTLALLFAEKYPEKVSKLLISQIYLADETGQKWNLETSRLFYPDIWERIEQEAETGEPVLDYYANLINSDDVMKQIRAANLAGSYERCLGSVNPRLGYKELTPENLAEIRISLNYLHERYFMAENQILKNVDKIADIPTLMVHNRLDIVCPLLSAYNLHKKLPKSKLVVVPGRGHFGPQLNEAVYREIKDYLGDK